MAIVAKGSLADGMSGTLGDVVLKRYVDKTVAQKKPTSLKKSNSIVQQFRRHHFRKGVRYAKSVLRDPALSAQMAPQVPEGQRLYNYLVKWWCETHPLIDEVDDNGPVQGVERFISVPVLKSRESLVVSREYTVNSVASSLFVERAERVRTGADLLMGEFCDDGLVRLVMERLRGSGGVGVF